MWWLYIDFDACSQRLFILQGFWEDNRKSLLRFLGESHRGVKGFVKDENFAPIEGASMKVTLRRCLFNLIYVIFQRFAGGMLVSKQQKKASSGEFFCREFTQWKSLPRDSLPVRSSLRLSSRIQPCSMSHCTRWDGFSYWIIQIPEFSSLINLPVII